MTNISTQVLNFIDEYWGENGKTINSWKALYELFLKNKSNAAEISYEKFMDIKKKHRGWYTKSNNKGKKTQLNNPKDEGSDHEETVRGVKASPETRSKGIFYFFLILSIFTLKCKYKFNIGTKRKASKLVGDYDDSDDNAGDDGAYSKLPPRTRSKTGSKLLGDYDDNGDNAGDDGADSRLPPTTRSKNAKRPAPAEVQVC